MLKTRRTVLVFLRLNSCWLLDQTLRWKLSLIRDFITTLIMPPQYFCQIDQIPLHQVRYRRTVEQSPELWGTRPWAQSVRHLTLLVACSISSSEFVDAEKHSSGLSTGDVGWSTWSDVLPGSDATLPSSLVSCCSSRFSTTTPCARSTLDSGKLALVPEPGSFWAAESSQSCGGVTRN